MKEGEQCALGGKELRVHSVRRRALDESNQVHLTYPCPSPHLKVKKRICNLDWITCCATLNLDGSCGF
jgi:hypothetical protein